MTALRARTVPVASVGPAERAALWALFAETYVDVNEATFQDDFDAKDHVILLDDGQLRGFSTLKELRVDVDGQTHVGMFSGDTVVARAYWGIVRWGAPSCRTCSGGACGQPICRTGGS